MSTPVVTDLSDGVIYVQITEAPIPGQPGAPGVPGPEGQPGPQGSQGPTGPQGSTGTGVTIVGHSDDGNPPVSDGSVGDAWLDPTTGGMWIWDGGGWIYQPGTTGAPGPQGLQGPPGPQGVRGETGLTGPAGPGGATGPTGPGVAAGGVTDAVLVKNGSADGNTRWSTNWLLNADGNPRIGTGATVASQCVLVAHGAPAPAGLPNGTLIFEQPS